jgi:hypothetical protein
MGLDRSVQFCGVLWKALSWGAVKASLGEMRAFGCFEDYINRTDLVVAPKNDGGWLGYAGTCIAHFPSGHRLGLCLAVPGCPSLLTLSGQSESKETPGREEREGKGGERKGRKSNARGTGTCSLRVRTFSFGICYSNYSNPAIRNLQQRRCRRLLKPRS